MSRVDVPDEPSTATAVGEVLAPAGTEVARVTATAPETPAEETTP